MFEKIGASLAALALCAAAGAGLQALLPKPLERAWGARLGTAYLLGLAWLGLAAWFLGFAGVPLGRPLWLALALAPCVAGVAAAISRGHRGGLGSSEGTAAASRWLTGLVLVVLAAESVALVAHTAAEPVSDFDGRMTWGTQARYLEASGSVLPDALRDERTYVIHPRYPILLPLLQVATTGIAVGSLDGFGVRPLYALFFPAFAAALWPALRRAGGAGGAALATLLLFTAPLLLVERDAGPLGTYSDFPLAAFLGIGFVQLLHPRTRLEPWRGWSAGLLLAAAAGAKNEGMLLAPAALVIALLATRRGGRSSGAFVRAAVVLACALALIVVWRIQIPNRNDEGYFEAFEIGTLVLNLPERLGAVGQVIVARTFDREAWGFLFWLAPPLLIVGRRGLSRRACRAAGGLVAVELALVLVAYCVVGDPDATMSVTWNRFLLQMTAPLALLLAAASGRVLVAARLPAIRSIKVRA